MTTFDVSGKQAFSKHCGKRRKCWKPAFSPFPTMFSALSKTKIIIYVTFILSSANAFNLDKVKFLLFGKGLNQFHLRVLVNLKHFTCWQNFRLAQIEKICRRQHKCHSNIWICFGKGRKHCVKKRKCWLPAFSPFSTMFSKGFLQRVGKSWDSLVKS